MWPISPYIDVNKKSSCVNARGIPPAPHNCPGPWPGGREGEGGVPCPGLGEGREREGREGYPVLARGGEEGGVTGTSVLARGEEEVERGGRVPLSWLGEGEGREEHPVLARGDGGVPCPDWGGRVGGGTAPSAPANKQTENIISRLTSYASGNQYTGYIPIRILWR